MGKNFMSDLFLHESHGMEDLLLTFGGVVWGF